MSKGIPKFGDRATQYMTYPNFHASDIEDATYLYHHNPAHASHAPVTLADDSPGTLVGQELDLSSVLTAIVVHDGNVVTHEGEVVWVI